MLRSSRMVKGDKIRSLAHVCSKGRQPMNRAHADESWDLRTIQHKDKLVLAKDRPGAQRWESSISVLFWKANITYSGKHKIPNTGTKKLKCPVGGAALEMSVFWISEWLNLSTWSPTYQPHLGLALRPSHGCPCPVCISLGSSWVCQMNMYSCTLPPPADQDLYL